MEEERTLQLKEGSELNVTIYTYPIPVIDQMILIELWRTEWTRGDYDWLQSMSGAYSQTLKIRAAIGRIGGQPVGTASVCYPIEDPEVSVVGSVLTHPDYRGLGVAAYLTDTVVELSFAAGCQVAYLGATRDPRCVYLRCGFQRWNGGVMRRAAPGSADFEVRYFAAEQTVSVREARWGDLPGLACFVVQPLDCLVLDYPRSLLSGKYVKLQRCVSNLPVVYDHVTDRGGAMCVLVGNAAHRVLGFGTLTPEPGEARSHKAVIDVITYDHYDTEADTIIKHLMSQARQRDIRTVQAYVASCDTKKAVWFKRSGLRPVTKLPGQLCVGGKMLDVVVLEEALGKNEC